LQEAITSDLFKMTGITLLSLHVADTIAVEKSLTTSRSRSGEMMKTINVQEWHHIKGKWLIVNDIDVLIK
jgi:GH43 family beta-xylosidase